jgi:NADPH2:quinone reductase
MKAIIVSRHGGPEVLELQEVPDPQPNDREVVVQVQAAGVNFADAMMAAGTYPAPPALPYGAGFEFAGTVEGSGERVMGFSRQGAFAQRLAVKPNELLPIPPNVGFAEAAAFPVNYFTAYFAYWVADAKPDERVLIHAAAGGVGTAAVELGKVFGVETFGTSSSEEKLSRLGQLGLEHPINYANSDYEQAVKELTGGEGVDVVFEMLGGEHPAKSIRCLRHLGRLVVYGNASGQPPQFDFNAMFERNAAVHALWLMPFARHPDLMQQAWQDMSAWLAEGKLHPIVGQQLPLEQAGEAVRLLTDRKNFGKVVLTIS